MPDVTASLCYLAPLESYRTERPFKIIPAAEEKYEEELSNIVGTWHDNIMIKDIRARKNNLRLEYDGLEALSHTSGYTNLDDVLCCEAYKRENSDMLMKHFQAERVVCFDFRVLLIYAGCDTD